MDEAQAAFQRALAADPKAAEAVRGLAMVNMTQGKEQEAKALYERYLQLAPSAPDAARIRKVVQSLSAQ
jgi:regulator of sirC expression with transglutaminase-like and TPR domain